MLTGKGALKREAIYWHYPHYNRHPHSFPSAVVRAGDWKLIQAFETGKISLYNLADDLGETTDLATTDPARVKKLQSLLSSWQQEVGADPMRPNPQYKGDRR